MVTESEYAEASAFLLTLGVIVSIIIAVIVFAQFPYAILVVMGLIVVALVTMNLTTVIKYHKENK